MKIDRDCYLLLAAMYAVGTVLAVSALVFIDTPWVSWPLFIACVWFVVWQTFFFRVPSRRRGGGQNSVVSVADGKIVVLEKTFEPEYFKDERIQVSVYMNFFDVHANFFPLDGVIRYFKYVPGEHLFAFAPKASSCNEHTLVTIESVGGKEVLFKQLAGVFARRIVCHAEPGQDVKAGEQCGIIKFGSRIDFFFPLDADIKVKLGDLVRACETVICEL